MGSTHRHQSPKSRGLCDTAERNACEASVRDTEEAARKDLDATPAKTIRNNMKDKILLD